MQGRSSLVAAMKKLLLVLVVIAVLAVVFVAGRLSAPDLGSGSPARSASAAPPSAPQAVERVAVTVRETPAPATDGEVVTEENAPASTAEALLAATKMRSPFVRTLKLHAIVQDVPPGEMAGLLQSLDEHPNKREKDDARKLLVQRWAELDPAAALQWSLSQPDENPYTQPFMGSVFATWAASDPEAALQAAAGLGEERLRRGALQSVINAVSKTDYRRAHQLMQQHAEIMTNSWRYHSIFREWGREDPQAAVQAAMAISNPQERHGALTGAYQGWAADNPEAAFLAVQQMEPGRTRKNMFGNILQQISTKDPQAALEMYGQLSPGDVQSWTVQQIYSNWGASEPQLAMEHAMQNLIASNTRNQAISGIMQRWYYANREEAMAAVEQMDNPVIKNRILQSLVQNVSGNDIDQAYDLLDMMGAGQQRDWAIQSLARQLAEEDVSVAIQFINDNVSGNSRSNTMNNMMFNMIHNDPQICVEMIGALPYGDQRENMISNFVSQWTQNDPEAALEWASSLENDYERERALQQYYGNLANADPIAVAEMALTMDDDKLANSTLRSSVRSWAQNDPEGALAWASALADPDQRKSALASAVSTWAQSEPVAALEWVNRLPEGEERERYVQQAISQMSWSSPADAIEWIDSQPEDDKFKDTKKNVVNNWLRKDLPAAAAYVAEMQPGDNRDEAIRTLVQQVDKYEPAYAAEWSLRVQDDKQRGQLLGRSLREWGKKDKFAARQFVITQGFPDDERTKYLDMLK